MSRLNLGDKVRDRISGYEGICISKLQFLAGCDQVGIKPQGQKPDGGTFDALYFDEPFVELIGRDVITPVVARKPGAGGPSAIVTRG